MRCKMKFAEKVKYARMKLLLTQEALAKELGVSYATICRWEKDNRDHRANSMLFVRNKALNLKKNKI